MHSEFLFCSFENHRYCLRVAKRRSCILHVCAIHIAKEHLGPDYKFNQKLYQNSFSEVRNHEVRKHLRKCKYNRGLKNIQEQNIKILSNQARASNLVVPPHGLCMLLLRKTLLLDILHHNILFRLQFGYLIVLGL